MAISEGIHGFFYIENNRLRAVTLTDQSLTFMNRLCQMSKMVRLDDVKWRK